MWLPGDLPGFPDFFPFFPRSDVNSQIANSCIPYFLDSRFPLHAAGCVYFLEFLKSLILDYPLISQAREETRKGAMTR